MKAFNKDMDEGPGGDDTSDSDSDIVITSRSTAEFNQADTVVFEFEPRNKSTPKHKPENEGKALGHSSTTQPGQIVISDTEDMGPPKTNTDKTTCYSTYTDLYAPCVEEEDEELVAVNMTSLLDTEIEEMNNLKDRPIFDGPDGRRFLVYNAND
ncbi:hypothetical protein CesoFtcFv8_007982 [Champsocephalus esox]|uniref:Uncharacterized protein n=1 Tax=Champsocephalus esox TaxID=159716 RepID=A0AAN8H7U2_9TELE|nr:hypothetical protein CesoFtcFv8_007982 [Champsocephalus esox]